MNFIELYRNSLFCGFVEIDTVDSHLNSFERRAEELRDYIDWDEVIIYAIYSYDEETNMFVAADFMLLRMAYEKYVDLASKISPSCRIFFKSNYYKKD